MIRKSRKLIIAAVVAAWLLGFAMFMPVIPSSAPAAASPLLPSINDPLFTNPIADPNAIPKFVNPVPKPTRIDMRKGGKLQMTFGQTTEDLGLLGPNPATPLLTKVFGFGANGAAVTYPGPTIVAQKNVPIKVTWHNKLGFSYPLPVDTSFPWAFSDPAYAGHSMADLGIPAVPHLHGGHTASTSDGTPMQWWTPKYEADPTNPLYKGPDFSGNVFTYDNSQDGATLWYHDHAMGITRLNVYMGLAGFYFLRDQREEALTVSKRIPGGQQENELVIQDRTFYPDGQLAYPDVPAPDVPGFQPWPGGPSIQTEFFGNTILVNGKAWPIMDVQARKYRFRILNGSDSRFYNMHLDAPVPVSFTQIGTDDGLMSKPVVRNELLMGPGERYDVVVDFSNPALRGKTIIVRNDAATPYPSGDPVDPDTTGQIMAFRVGSTSVRDNVKTPNRLRSPIKTPAQTGATRKLLLWETKDQYGRTEPILGTVSGGAMAFMDPVTETPKLNTTEVWEIYNTTVDAHPMHLHLVAFQALSRQDFTATQDPNTGALTNITLQGSPSPPLPTEVGKKDTLIMYPGQVTRIIATFDRPGKYVWHCHILSHEEHDMMRPLMVVP